MNTNWIHFRKDFTVDCSTYRSACKKDSKQRQSRETFEANLNE